jgi:hypothetical protein
MPPVSWIAANCLSVRFRECGLKACALECVATSGNVPEPAFIKVRQIDQNPQSVAGANQFLAEVRQTWSRVGRRGTEERHAMLERIRPAPNGSERAKSGFIQHVQKLEIRVDCFRALNMKNRCQHAVVQALLDIIDVAADAC